MTFLDYVSVMIKWKRFIIVNTFVVCAVTAGISLVIPEWYKSTTTIMPPHGEGIGMGAGLSSLMNALPMGSVGLGLPGGEEGARFIAILESRTVMEAVAREYDLTARYKARNMEETIRTLRGRVDVKINDEGTITLNAEAKTPYLSGKQTDDEARDLARDMANTFISQLDLLNKRLKVEDAKNTRLFIEGRYLQNVEDLRNAEEEFKRFQEQYGTIALPEQTTATIAAAAELKAEIIAKEVEMGLYQNYFRDSHDKIVELKNELKELEDKYSEFIYRSPETRIGDRQSALKDIFVPMEEIPDLGIQFARLYREVTMQETIMEFLLPQYEQAKIQEARDTPTVQVLDPGIRPVKKSKPKRMFLVLGFGLISLLFHSLAVYIHVNVEHVKETNPDQYRLIQSISNQLRPRNWLK